MHILYMYKKQTKKTTLVRNLCIILYSCGLADASTLNAAFRKKKPQVYQMLVIPLKQTVQSKW